MKKITKIMALLLVVVMVFTGCGTMESTTKIDSNGAATMISVLSIEKAAVDKYITETYGFSNPESYIKTWIEDQYLMDSYYEVVTRGGVEYYEMRRVSTLKSKKLAQDFNYATLMSIQGIYLTKDTVYGTVDNFEFAFNDFSSIMTGMQDMGIDVTKKVKIKLNFEFPANIVSTNGTVDSTNPKKVSFDVSWDLENPTTIFATTTASTQSEIAKIVKADNKIKKPTVKSIKYKGVTANKRRVIYTLKFKKVKDCRFEAMYSTVKDVESYRGDWGFKYSKKDSNTIDVKLKPGKKYYFHISAFKKNAAGMIVYSKMAKTKIKTEKIK